MSEVKKLRVRGREVEVVTRGAPRKPQRPPVVRADASDLMDLFDALGEIPEDDLTLGEALRQLEESESDDG